MPRDDDAVPTIELHLLPDDLAALDAWIARSADPQQSRADAARAVIAGALGSHYPSTMMPGFITGRDIV